MGFYWEKIRKYRGNFFNKKLIFFKKNAVITQWRAISLEMAWDSIF